MCHGEGRILLCMHKLVYRDVLLTCSHIFSNNRGHGDPLFFIYTTIPPLFYITTKMLHDHTAINLLLDDMHVVLIQENKDFIHFLKKE